MAKSIYETENFQFELIDGNSQKRNIDALLEDFDISSLPLNTTKKDYLIACCIGAISGFVDAFFVNEISLDKAAIWGQKEVNQFGMFMARRSGYIGDDLTGAIRQLEKNVLVSDSVMSEFGGSNQHHLRDFSHHFSLLGLVCSIYVQFSGKVIGTDEHGQLKTVRVAKELLGKNTEEKIYLGTVDWLFHMASDMAGSVRSPGKGTGIPGPLLSFLKEISALPFFRSGKADEINCRQWISKLFNGTAFANRDANNKLIPQRFDLRCEIGLLAEVAKSSLPVIINECVTRAYYFVKQLTLVIKDKTINDFGGINDAFLKEILPFNNVSLTRLLTISHGVMISIDMTDAVIRGAIETYLEGKQKGFYRIALRVNYPGIGKFVISGFIDTKNTVRRASAIKDQVSKTVAKGIDLKAFSLTAKQARIYWSLLYNIVLKDCSETKTKNVRDRKKLWLADWTNKTLLTIGIPSVELAEFFFE